MESIKRLREYVNEKDRWGMSHSHVQAINEIADAIEEEFKEQELAHAFAHSQVYEFASNLKGQLLDFDKMDEQQDAMAANGWVKLPVDADGEVIHVDDTMDRGNAHGRVIALMLSNYPKKWGGGLHWSIQLEGEQAPTALDLTFHHHHAFTVEDVLSEMLDAVDDDRYEQDRIIAEYAVKLREMLAGDAE